MTQYQQNTYGDTIAGVYDHFYPAFDPACIDLLVELAGPGPALGLGVGTFNKRWLGTRIKHTMGPVSIKLYDKFSVVLRIETTVNDVSFFDQYRQVHQRDGTTSSHHAPMKKTIYSLPPLAETLQAAHQRYLKFISEIDTLDGGADKPRRLTETQTADNRRNKGFNLLDESVRYQSTNQQFHGLPDPHQRS